MTPARHIAADEPDPERIPLWMLPVILVKLIFSLFAQRVEQMKSTRRTHVPCGDLREHYDRLRLSEWAIESMKGQGAGILLRGEPLDIAKLTWPRDPPDWFRPDMPRTLNAMHGRFIDLARFHSAPERYVRRHAARILRRMRPGQASLRLAAGSRSNNSSSSSPITNTREGMRVRAPPWLQLNSGKPPSPASPPQGENAPARLPHPTPLRNWC